MKPPPTGVARPLVAAGAVFRDDEGRVLLVHPVYKPGWDVPGGMVEAGESPAVACRREIAEELGLDRVPGRLLSVDWTHGDGWDKLLFLFDGGPLDVDDEPPPATCPSCDEGAGRVVASATDKHRIVLQAEELDRWAWVATGDLADHLPPPLARRVGSTAAGAGPYLEHGLTVTPDGHA